MNSSITSPPEWTAADIVEEMAQKLRDYLGHGVRMVWYVEPASRQIRVFTDFGLEKTLTLNDELSGGSVLPGFRWPIGLLFREPEAGTAGSR